MSWTQPRVIEVAVGMEINAYACAELTSGPAKSRGKSNPVSTLGNKLRGWPLHIY